MRKFMLASAVVAGAALSMASVSSPAEARVFCYSRSTGQFLNWGHCRPVTTICTHYGPGGFCRPVRYVRVVRFYY
jgi:hypothetical protein